jgi:hypothetical protein
VDRLLGAHGIPKDSPSGRRRFADRLEAHRRAGDQPETWAAVRRGWCLGDEDFRKELLAQVSERHGSHHYGTELQEAEEEKAERLVREELVQRKWTEKELMEKSKTDRQKAILARRLRQETTMTMAWIARRLHMGSINTLKNTLRLTNSRDPIGLNRGGLPVQKNRSLSALLSLQTPDSRLQTASLTCNLSVLLI